jgi:ABC-type antimicrobial peptide transport system permease subunit
MLIKNLLRRKTRTLLTVLGISIGVAAIIGLGAMADGMQSGYSAMLGGSKADLVISQPNSFDITYSSVDETLGEQIAVMPEVGQVSGMLQGFVQAEDNPLFFVFGYPLDSFALSRFQIISGSGPQSREGYYPRGKPLWLGSAAAEVFHKNAGDTLRLGGSAYRVVGIYQTGDAFEDSGALLSLVDAQDLLGKPRQVSLYYVQLESTDLRQRFLARVQRLWPDLLVSGANEFANKQTLTDILKAFVWVIGGFAILLGGVGMLNAQLMAIFERTREIGVLRAVGWSSRRVLGMILGETMLVCLAGGVLGIGLGWLSLYGLSQSTTLLGVSVGTLSLDLILQALAIVLALGLVGGFYPAWRASRMPPVEALRYEAGSTGKRVHRLPFGGMALQSLAQRTTRTLLTLGVIGITVGVIMALDGVVRGFADSFTQSALSGDMEIIVRQANISDTSLSAIDERTGSKIAAMPEVASASGLIFTAIMMPEVNNFFILEGYSPNQAAIQRVRVVEGQTLTNNRQILLGRVMADALNKKVGESIELSRVRFRIVGIFESNTSWEEMGGIISLRDAQALAGRPRKVSLYGIKLHDPSMAQAVVEKINQQFPDVYAALVGQFADQLPDMQNSNSMMAGISFLAIAVGGVGVLNTMLMAVFERTREIGVLRALGWRRRGILTMILREALMLGILGGIAGILFALGITALLQQDEMMGSFFTPVWTGAIFGRAILVSLSLGLLGGFYPALRATRLLPVEALRYE